MKAVVNGTVVNADSIEENQTIIFDEVSGKIVWIGKSEEAVIPDNCEVLDASGCLVIPGGIDPHVHMQYPQGDNKILTADSFESGSEAALLGGTTSIIDFVEPIKGTSETMIEALEKRKSEAEGSCLVDYTFHMTIHTLPCNLDSVKESGICSYKLYTAYGIRLEGEELSEALKSVDKIGGIAIVHCEDNSVILEKLSHFVEEYDKGNFEMGNSIHYPEVRPDYNEMNATKDVIDRMRKAHEENKSQHQLRLHIAHISVPDQVKLLGNGVSGEICPHHFILDDSVFKLPGAQHYQCAPPIRTVKHVEGLQEILRDTSDSHTLFCVTDHCPFTKGQRDGKEILPNIPGVWWKNEEKPLPFWVRPGGLPGIQERLELLYEVVVGSGVKTISDDEVKKLQLSADVCSQLKRFVSLSSTNAAERYNLKTKGKLTVGYDADITILRPTDEPHSIVGGHTRSGMCLYTDKNTHIIIQDVFRRGAHLVHECKLTDETKTSKGLFLRQDL